jgi:uncharacterized protein (DUF2141 family)
LVGLLIGAVAVQSCDAVPKPPEERAAEHTINVEIRGGTDDIGVLRIAVYADPRTFLREGGVLHGVTVPPSTRTVSLAVPTGRPVVISVFQDLNADEQLQRGPLGIPTEPWGFSGRPPTLGPPTWTACAVTPEPGASIVITLRGTR